MGRTPSCRGDGLSDEVPWESAERHVREGRRLKALALRALKPVKRPADWGAELPEDTGPWLLTEVSLVRRQTHEDPILCSQAPPAVLTGQAQASSSSFKLQKASKSSIPPPRPRQAKASKQCEREGSASSKERHLSACSRRYINHARGLESCR